MHLDNATDYTAIIPNLFHCFLNALYGQGNSSKPDLLCGRKPFKFSNFSSLFTGLCCYVMCNHKVDFLIEMPQKNKSKTSYGTLQELGPESGEPPPQPQTEVRASLAPGDKAEDVKKDLEDLEIIKSPSDPKKYRYKIKPLS